MSSVVIVAIYLAFLVVIYLHYRHDTAKILDMARRAHLTSVPPDATTEPVPA